MLFENSNFNIISVVQLMFKSKLKQLHSRFNNSKTDFITVFLMISYVLKIESKKLFESNNLV